MYKILLEMTNQIGLLLFEIDRESSQIHQEFRHDQRHRSLDDFSRALSTQQTLDGIVKSDGELSDIEAKVLGTFYAALGFRMTDTSTKFDEEKFRRAEEIIERAEDMTMSVEPAVHKAKYHLSGKTSKFAPQKRDRVFGHIDRYANMFRWVLSNDYVNLLVDTNSMFKLHYFVHNFKKYSRDGFVQGAKRGAKLFGGALYEMSRMLAFLYSSVVGIENIANGNYERGAVEIGIAIAIPLSRYTYRKRKIEEILGPNYHMPKLQSVSSNNR